MRSTWIKGVVFSVQILWIFGSALIWWFLFPGAHIIPLPQSHRKLIQIENWKLSQLVRINLYTSQSTQSYCSLMFPWFLFNADIYDFIRAQCTWTCSPAQSPDFDWYFHHQVLWNNMHWLAKFQLNSLVVQQIDNFVFISLGVSCTLTRWHCEGVWI